MNRSILHSSKLSFISRILLFVIIMAAPFVSAQEDEYLSWTARQAEQVGKSLRVSGRVGSLFNFRGLSTDRATNYKLRATWLSPEVIQASDDGLPLFSDSAQEAELVVRIHNMEGKVSWRIPESIRKRIAAQAKKSEQETGRNTQIR